MTDPTNMHNLHNAPADPADTSLQKAQTCPRPDLMEEARKIERRLPAWKRGGSGDIPNLVIVQAIATALAAAEARGREEAPKGWKWQLVPDYPEGEVVGPCICGGWPGGKCLKCPPVRTPPQTEEGEG